VEPVRGALGRYHGGPWRTQPLFAALDSERRCARVFINRHHQLEWPAGCTLSAHEVYHLIKPIDEREAFS